jgi:hypothetical protein
MQAHLQRTVEVRVNDLGMSTVRLAEGRPILFLSRCNPIKEKK